MTQSIQTNNQKPFVKQDVPSPKSYPKDGYDSDSTDSNHSSLSSTNSVQSSVRSSITEHPHVSDFGSSPKRLKCIKHKIDFDSMGDFKHHNINEHPRNCHCSTCGKGYSTQGQLQNHINVIHLSMTHKCPVSDWEVHFMSKKGLDL